ncbi:hypothetical protein [Salinibacterium sp. ZJ454]|uniref:PKD domain-containing protein n=1 Tax=Salinibacterium sp. ZJ454 TaxID=2708339 RepID=UPI00141DEB21|nr:hypothetical protein [Salinibacterium sp. ZJ454]
MRAEAAIGCSESSVILGDCTPTATTGSDQVDLSIDYNQGNSGSGGSGSSNSSRNTSGTDNRSDAGDSPSTAEPAPLPPGPCPGFFVLNGEPFCDVGYSTALGSPPPGPGPATAPYVVTVRDIASFRPTSAIQSMEPDGWMVVGLDTNFVAAAAQHVRSGTLLGQPAEVRFSPVSYHWSYGDDTSRAGSSPGASWAALGLEEFDPTSTSHVYGTAGTFTISLTVNYAPEYRYAGGSWTSIAGTVGAPGNQLVATAGDVKTVLVAMDCRANPSGPGC